MNVIDRIFGFINGLYLFAFIYLVFSYASAIFAVLGNPFGLFVYSLIVLVPVIIGIVFSIKNWFFLKKKLSPTDKVLNAFPLINLSIILLGIVHTLLLGLNT